MGGQSGRKEGKVDRKRIRLNEIEKKRRQVLDASEMC